MEGEFDRVRVPDEVVAREFEEETVVLHLGTGRYHGLNPTGALMLESLRETGSVQAAADAVAASTGAPADEIVEDVRTFCASLAERGLVVLESGG